MFVYHKFVIFCGCSNDFGGSFKNTDTKPHASMASMSTEVSEDEAEEPEQEAAGLLQRLFTGRGRG